VADDALTLLHRYLEAYRADPRAVLAPDALIQAAGILTAAVPEALRPSQNQGVWALAVHAPAMLHLLRARELGDDGCADAEAAATLFGIIQRTTPGAVPEQVAPMAADPARQDLISRGRGVIAWEQPIAVLNAVAAGTRNLAILAEVARLWTAAIEQTPAGDPRRARYWTRLAATQVTRFELTGSAADIDGAIGVHRHAQDAYFGGAGGDTGQPGSRAGGGAASGGGVGG